MISKITRNKYPWYETVNPKEELQQGDFILKCQIFQPKVEAYETGQQIKTKTYEYDVIVLSQSCDLIAEKIKLALVCPFYTLTELTDFEPEYRNPKMKDKLRNGFIVGMHLLDKCNINGKTDYLVVDFKSTYAVLLSFLKQICLNRGKRMRLLPPYREHLSQAFARFFMRVGLPLDIKPFS